MTNRRDFLAVAASGAVAVTIGKAATAAPAKVVYTETDRWAWGAIRFYDRLPTDVIHALVNTVNESRVDGLDRGHILITSVDVERDGNRWRAYFKGETRDLPWNAARLPDGRLVNVVDAAGNTPYPYADFAVMG